MSRLGSYKNTAFSESQKFLVLDPSTSSASLVLASELVAYITPKIGSVLAETTRLSAQNTDYKVGEMIQTSGSISIGDGLASVYLVVAGGDGDFPMINGNDLLIIVGDDALREQLISILSGQGASLVSMEGGPTVEVAVTAAEAAILNRVIRVTSRTEMKAYDVPANYQFSLEEGGRSGLFVVKAGTPPADTEEGIYIVLTNGNYAERISSGTVNVTWFGAVGDGVTNSTAAFTAAKTFGIPFVPYFSSGYFVTTVLGDFLCKRISPISGGGSVEYDATYGGYVFAGVGVPNANGVPPSDPRHLLEVTNDPTQDGPTGQLVRINSYGAASFGNNVHFCRYYGNINTPAAIGSGAFIMSTGYRGHDGADLSQSACAFQVLATETWAPGSHGSKFQFQTTAQGSTVRTQALEIDNRIIAYRDLVINESSGSLLAGVGTGSNHQIRKLLTNDSNAAILTIGNSGSGALALFYAVSNQGSNAANAAIKMGNDGVTGRSINAGGTINASGADYAEYMRKASGCGTILKGDIVGVNSNGELTDKFSESISFLVKSTDPSYVGGDKWGSKENLGLSEPDSDSETYEKDIVIFKEALEAERVNWDRMAYCGQVPINCTALVGEYVIPVKGNSDLISYISKEKPSFEEYMICVGKVIKIEDKPVIIVKVS
jgi:hypothetical protein